MRGIIYLFVFLMCVSSVFAYSADSYNIDFHIAFRKVVVEAGMDLSDNATGKLSIPIPSDAKAIELEVDGAGITPIIDDNYIEINVDSAKEVKWSYITKDFLDRTDFLSSVVMPLDIDNLRIRLYLPEHAILAVPLTETAGSAYPRPTNLGTDGRSILITWEKEGLKQGDESSLFVKYKTEKSSALFYTVLVLSAIAIIFLIVLVFTKKEKIKTIVRKEYVLERHLKEDEEQVVNILKQREDKCEQGTLRVITGFSKAKLSGLLKELEERKIVHKEKRGKKNLVFLKKR